MRDYLYRRKLLNKKIVPWSDKPIKSDFSSAAEEAAWNYTPPHDYRNVALPGYNGGSRYVNDVFSKTKVIEQKHGDFKSDYPYHVTRYLGSGAGYVGLDIELKRPTPPNTFSKGACAINHPNAVWVGGSLATSSYYNNVKTNATRAMNDKIFQDFASWDVLTDIAEGKETFSFLKQGVNALKEITAGCLLGQPKRVLKAFNVRPTKKRIRHVRRVFKSTYTVGDVAGSATRAAGSLWLSYRYGLMPLLYSAQDAINAFWTPLQKYSKTFQVTFRDRIVWENSTETVSLTTHLFDRVKYTYNQFSWRLRTTVDFSKEMMDRFISSPWDIPMAIWERVPYSFVVDWFLNVGNYLRDLKLESITGSLSSLGTLRDYCRSEWWIANIRPASTSYIIRPAFLPGNSKKSECRTFKREIVSYSPPLFPKLEWGLDRWKRQIDSICLLANFAKRPTLRGIP
nr:MAG: maturation protein [Sanya fiers-like virus 13]